MVGCMLYLLAIEKCWGDCPTGLIGSNTHDLLPQSYAHEEGLEPRLATLHITSILVHKKYAKI